MPGIGSPKGVKQGGRKVGTPNKRTAEIRDKIMESGLTPLEYFVKILRDEREDPTLRFEAAKAAAPYMHARIQSVEHTGKDGKALVIEVVKFAD